MSRRPAAARVRADAAQPRRRHLAAVAAWWRDDALTAESARGPVGPTRAYATREILRRLAPEVRPLRWWLVASIALGCVLPLVDAANVWLFKLLVDRVLVPRDLAPLVPIGLGFVAITLGGGALAFASSYLSTWVSETFVLGLRTRVFGHLHTLSLDFFERRKLGDLLARIAGDIDAVETFLVSGGAALVGYLFSLVVFAGLLFYLQWLLALVALVTVPVFWVVARLFAKRVRASVRLQRQISGATTAIAEESLSNVPLVQAYGRRDTEVGRYRDQGRLRRRARLRTARLRGALAPTTDLIELFGALAIFAIGTLEVRAGRLTIGGFLAFAVYLTKVIGPARGLGQLASALFAAAAGTERILEILDQRPSVAERADARPLAHVRGALAFDGVRFTYPGVSRPSLEGVTFRVEPGETMALVGPSGAGKSTVAKLLLRFYDPQAGAVRLDGHDLRDLSLDALRAHIAVMWQDALVFDASIADNVAYGRGGATRADVVAACAGAGLDAVAARLDGGYDAPVGQKGRLLSGGERQRVAIARAAIRDSPILILDEPTSHLDAASAHQVLQPLRRLVTGRTTLIISHNLLTVRDADRIAVLDEGRIVSIGSHETLLRTCGLYADLYRRHQAPAAAAAAEPA
ncbi:MAG: ATP-binding cassette, subfamily bacterial [Solirubrobacteraceae bacterium]|nr:ATP-binding cassette, subfamily bacterial [Solirubrobacteraceae bacterium]